MDLESIFIDFINAAYFPSVAAFDVQFVTNLKLFPWSLLRRFVVHRPLIAIKLDFHHEYIPILHIVRVLDQWPLVVIGVFGLASFDPKSGVSGRYVIKYLTNFQVNFAHIEARRNE